MKMTRKKYTVVFSCWDPVSPVEVRHTDSPKRAKAMFDVTKEAEEKDGGYGGEWELTLWEHSEGSFPETMSHDEVGVYNVTYQGSKKIASFSYMDLIRGAK